MPLYRIKDKLVFFVHVPKTGGTSVEKALESVGKVCLDKKIEGFPAPSQHFHAEIYNKLLPEDFYDRGFMIVRNPFTRLISEYRHKYSREKTKNLDFDAWVKKSFSTYQSNSYVHQNHIRPQVEFISPSVDIFKFEDGIQQCIDNITAYSGLEQRIILTREKLFEKTPIPARRDTFRRVADFYRNDFRKLDYDPENYDFIEDQKIFLK